MSDWLVLGCISAFALAVAGLVYMGARRRPDFGDEAWWEETFADRRTSPTDGDRWGSEN